MGRLGLDEGQWLVLALDIQKQSLQAIGGLGAVQRYNYNTGNRWSSGQRHLARIYSRVDSKNNPNASIARNARAWAYMMSANFGGDATEIALLAQKLSSLCLID